MAVIPANKVFTFVPRHNIYSLHYVKFLSSPTYRITLFIAPSVEIEEEREIEQFFTHLAINKSYHGDLSTTWVASSSFKKRPEKMLQFQPQGLGQDHNKH